MGVEMGIPTLEVAGGAESLLPPWVDKKLELGPDIDEPDSEEPDSHDEHAVLSLEIAVMITMRTEIY